MGKVQIIKKARKEKKCSKCGNKIHVGDSYYKGVINFHPDINRCFDCGLQGWEVTTSDYQLSVGNVVYNWQKLFDTVEEISSELENILDETQDKLDNMPEQLQYAPTGEMLQERIDNLQSTIDDLSNVDEDEVKEESLEEIIDEMQDSFTEEKSESFLANGYDYVINQDDSDDDFVSTLEERYREKLESLIEDALQGLEV